MTLSKTTFTLATLIALAGCTNAQKTDGDGKGSKPGVYNQDDDPVFKDKKDAFDFGGASWPDEKLYEGIEERMLRFHESDWKDSDVDFTHVSNASDADADHFVRIAEWVKNRRDVVRWCMDQKPQRMDQAIAILDKVVRNVPDASTQRLQLGWYLCSRGSTFYDFADSLAATITAREDEGKKDEAARLVPVVEQARARCERYQRAAIHHLMQYMALMPMDKLPVDLLWKCYFQIGEYENALKWLNQDISLIPDDQPVKKDYVDIREEIKGYLAEVKVKGYAKKKPKLPQGAAETEPTGNERPR